MPSSSAEPKKKSRTNWFVLVLNVIAIICLLLSYAAAAFTPTAMGYLSLFGLAYPFALLGNLIFVGYWFFKKRKYTVFSGLTILVGLNHFTHFFQLSITGSADPNASQLKVLTYNVHVFDVYDKVEGAATRDAIYDLLNREQADVICFQEFYQSEKNKTFPTRDTLLEFLPTPYYHERYTHAISGERYFGVVTLSKYPIVKKGFVPFSTDVNNFCIYVDILKDGDTLRVYNAHLQSIRLKPEDYDLAKGKTAQSEIDDASKRIAMRLKNAFVKRQEQVDRIAASIRVSPYPVILCGDFNDPPVSYTYSRLTDQLEDSFTSCGNGIGNTYIGAFPSFRIDYILHSKMLEAVNYQTLPEKLSDHHAITATFQWKQLGAE